MLLNLVFWFMGGSGTGLVTHLTITTIVVKNSPSPFTRLGLINLNLVIDNETNL
jgi:hypothetical protein